MYFLLFIGIVSIVYVKCFKDNFTQETIDKVTPVLILVTAFSIILILIGSIFGA